MNYMLHDALDAIFREINMHSYRSIARVADAILNNNWWLYNNGPVDISEQIAEEMLERYVDSGDIDEMEPDLWASRFFSDQLVTH
mgnify:CR=1 FL=1